MDISVDLSVLLYPSQWEAVLDELPPKAADAGVEIDNIAVEQLYSACEKENVLVDDYWLRHGQARSEEHTSELQSRGHLVCRLLLEKKKQNNTRSEPRFIIRFVS